MKNGIVKFFDTAKGFGFIQMEGTGEDVFVHKSGLVDDIYENNKVQFNMERGKKGWNAVNVRVVR